MEIKTPGQYVLITDKRFRRGISTFLLPAGTVINVTSIDYKADSFYSDELGWQLSYNQPVRPLDGSEFNRLKEVYALQ